ncbi:MAG: right-handed parallel beta-helix repeat-containing protein [Verrucomicrobia bacterium]|jgi:hypothetical protein|nr:right-handed parallel beta-helix repeat-containing protein [Verrucomicrobiota bacterium]
MNKKWTLPTLVLALGLTVSLTPANLFAQGTLTPPGAPAPTMKTLDQIEARTPVDATHTPGDGFSLFVIRTPGAYYLASNIVGVANQRGIEIRANNVTLDLNGFSLLGVSNAASGILVVNTCTNVTIHNGMISGWGNGYHAIRGLGRNLTLERLSITGNSFGLMGSGGDVIRDCLVSGNQRDGIEVFGSHSLVANNNVTQNNLQAGPGNASISVIGSNNRIEGNHVVGAGGGFGILCNFGSYTNNIFIKNSVIGNGANNYSITSGNIVGPFLNTTDTITNSNPWANFSF